jgi:hypothetical protein
MNQEAQAPWSHLDCDRVLAAPFPTRHDVFQSAFGQVLRAPARVLSGMLTTLALLRDLLFQDSFTGVLAICVLAGFGAWLLTTKTPPYAARYTQGTKSESFKYARSGSTARRPRNHRHQGGDPSPDLTTAGAFSAQTSKSRTARAMRPPATADSAHIPRNEDGAINSTGANSGISQNMTSATWETRRTRQWDQILSSESAAPSGDEQRTTRNPTSALPSPKPGPKVAASMASSAPPRSWLSLYNSRGGNDTDHDYEEPTRPTRSYSDMPSAIYSAAYTVPGVAPSRPEKPEEAQQPAWSCVSAATCYFYSMLPTTSS